MSPDDRLQAAFTTVGPSRKSQAITLGTLGGFVSLFPSKFDGTFLGKLGGLLSVRGSRQGVRTEPSLIVDLGVGRIGLFSCISERVQEHCEQWDDETQCQEVSLYSRRRL
jgi:hypothetical protein